MKEQHTRTVWIPAENAEEATMVDKNTYWLFPSAEEAWKALKIPGNAPRCYRCRPYQVTITATTTEEFMPQSEVDELTRLSKEADAEFRRRLLEAK